MKTSNSFLKSDSSIGPARDRLTAAETGVESARREWKLAKRKRKEAKEAARRAKKRLRRAKKELADARRLVSQAEEKRPRRIDAGPKVKRVKTRASRVAVSKPRKKKIHVPESPPVEQVSTDAGSSRDLQIAATSTSETESVGPVVERTPPAPEATDSQ